MTWNIDNIFRTMPISGPTINNVPLPQEFRDILFTLIPLLLVITTLIFLSKKQRFSAAVRQAIVTTFFISGFLWALHADLGWSTWLRNDLQTFGGRDVEQKLLSMEGGLYDFVRASRRVLKDDYMLYASDDYIKWRTEYFLLPLRKREQASDIIVLADDAARYDPATRTFTRGPVTIPDVDPVLLYAPDAYILRKR